VAEKAEKQTFRGTSNGGTMIYFEMERLRQKKKLLFFKN